MNKTIETVHGFRIERESDAVRVISEVTGREFSFRGTAARAWLEALDSAKADEADATFLRDSVAGFGVRIQ